jgi:alpha-beta hydrolase superfamily lysophospholipase
MTEFQFQGGGGLNLFARAWRSEAIAPRAVVVIAHGVNSHGGYYTWVGEQLAAAGFAVYAIDHRGRGRSDGERYFVQSIDEYTGDLATFIQLAKAREPGLPVFLLGHSAGGVISATYALEHQSELAGFICESFAFQVYAPDFALAVVKGLSHIAPHAHVLRLPIKEFSRDPTVVEAMLADPMIADEVQPTSTVAALVRADERLKEEFPRLTLPVLILHGTADKVTRPSGSELFHERAGSADKTLKLYEDYAHDLLNDIGKEAVLADIRAWIEARLPR